MDRQSPSLNLVTAPLLVALVVFFVGALSPCMAAEKASTKHQKDQKDQKDQKSTGAKIPGWAIESVTKDLGLCRYFVTADGMRVEYPMFIVVAETKTELVTVGNWETQKRFTFPIAKTSYYLKLMGFSEASRHKSNFEQQYKQSNWKKTRELKIQDLPATEYEKHVLNPPAGRTRTQYQIVAHLSCLPDKFYIFFNDLVHAEPAQPNAIVIGDRTVITNPSEGWDSFNTKSAKQVMLPKSAVGFPPGFEKVGTVSEIFLNDAKQVPPGLKTIQEKLKNKSKI